MKAPELHAPMAQSAHSSTLEHEVVETPFVFAHPVLTAIVTTVASADSWTCTLLWLLAARDSSVTFLGNLGIAKPSAVLELSAANFSGAVELSLASTAR